MHDETRTTAGQRHEPAHRTRNMTETPEERSHRLSIAIDSHSPSTYSQNTSIFSLLVPSCMIHSAVLFSLLSHTCFIFISNFPQNWVSQAWCACSYEHATFEYATFIFRGISRQWTKQSPLPQLAFHPLWFCCVLRFLLFPYCVRKRKICFHIPGSTLYRLLKIQFKHKHTFMTSSLSGH